MGIIELVLLGVAFFAAGVATSFIVIANNKKLARKFINED